MFKKKKNKSINDILSIIYYYHEIINKHVVNDSTKNTSTFLRRKLFLESLIDILKHL